MIQLDDLAGVQTAVDGQQEADYADQGEEVDIAAAEHFHAQ